MVERQIREPPTRALLHDLLERAMDRIGSALRAEHLPRLGY
jgi:hypothetical protein